MMRAVLAIACVSALAGLAHADDDFSGTKIVFARGDKLLTSDAKGKGEAELVTLPAKATVRALRTDALGKILLADVGGTWSYMALDGSAKSLTELPCDAGPAQLAEDGLCVLCRAKKGGSIIVNLVTNKVTPVDIPVAGARLAGSGADRKLVWADKGAVWTAPPNDPKKAKQVTKQAPLRGLLPSPDGTHALGTYEDEVFESVKKKKTADVLEVFALDGEGARRKAIQNGVAVEWSHDSKWVLVQDGASACIMLAAGGQYKCWRGYTAAAIAPDGRYALLLGNRSSESSKKDKKTKAKAKKPEKKPAPDEETSEPENPEGEEPAPVDDVAVAPPGGPVSLYRAQLEGAFTTSPALIARVVDGAAVWIPTSAPSN